MDVAYILFIASVALIFAGFLAMVVTRLYVSFILVLVNFSIFFIIFLADMLNGGPTSAQYLGAVNRDFMAVRPTYVVSGDFYLTATVLWHMFAHVSWMHLMWNLIYLIIFGIGLENKIKRPGFLLCFIAGGVGGTLFTTAMAYLAPDFFGVYPATGGVGASGAISGILGTYVVLYPRDRPFSGRGFRGFFSVWVIVLMYLAIESFFMFFNLRPGVGHGAHIGGVIAGILVAPLVRRLIPPTKDAPIELAGDSLDELRSMAEVAGQEKLFRKIEEEDIPEVRQAWVEDLIKKTSCPRCGKKPGTKDGLARCQCGWRMRY
jgi:membrane associated rhomboid family serine protease